MLYYKYICEFYYNKPELMIYLLRTNIFVKNHISWPCCSMFEVCPYSNLTQNYAHKALVLVNETNSQFFLHNSCANTIYNTTICIDLLFESILNFL